MSLCVRTYDSPAVQEVNGVRCTQRRETRREEKLMWAGAWTDKRTQTSFSLTASGAVQGVCVCVCVCFGTAPKKEERATMRFWLHFYTRQATWSRSLPHLNPTSGLEDSEEGTLAPALVPRWLGSPHLISCDQWMPPYSNHGRMDHPGAPPGGRRAAALYYDRKVSSCQSAACDREFEMET